MPFQDAVEDDGKNGASFLGCSDCSTDNAVAVSRPDAQDANRDDSRQPVDSTTDRSGSGAGGAANRKERSV